MIRSKQQEATRKGSKEYTLSATLVFLDVNPLNNYNSKFFTTNTVEKSGNLKINRSSNYEDSKWLCSFPIMQNQMTSFSSDSTKD